MKIQNVNPAGDVYVAALDMQLVKRGEVVEVSEEAAAVLLIQTENWALPDKAPKGDREFADKAIAEELAALLAASAPPAAPVEVGPVAEPVAPAEGGEVL